MLRRATATLALLLALIPVFSAQAQQDPLPVTVREIQAISPDSVAKLNRLGASATQAAITPLVFNDLAKKDVSFTAVVLADPLNSGNASVSNNRVGRIHVFVRDTAAVRLGMEGMTIQLVDGAYETSGLGNVTYGDVVKVVATVTPFNTQMQLTPKSIEVLGSWSDLGLPESILAPVEMTSADLNEDLGDGTGMLQVNWDTLGAARHQYVELKNATVLRRTVNPTGRVDWIVTTDNGKTAVNVYDVSLRYRNDRTTYPDAYNKRTSKNPFTPPPPGSVVNLRGFIAFPWDDPFTVGAPNGAILSIVPWTDEDLVVVETPPIITNLTRPAFVPDATTGVTVTADVAADPSRQVTSVVLKVKSSAGTDTTTINPASTSGTTYTFDIPAQADGAFVSYWVEAVDNKGAASTSDVAGYRVLADGINAIEDIQRTASGGFGASPFNGLTVPMDLTVTVQSNPATSGAGFDGVAVQDDPNLGPWSGLLVLLPQGLTVNPGDELHITRGTIGESFDVTRLTVAPGDVTVTATGGTPYAYKDVTTGLLQDRAIMEAHEGMMLNFPNVEIVKPDAGNGEWTFASVVDGALQPALSADDAARDIPSDFGKTNFVAGQRYDYMRGIGWYSFNAFKLVPETASDIGALQTAVEDGTLPSGYALGQNYPNPFNPTTTIAFQVGRTGHATLQVFDLMGRHVATLVDGAVTAGAHTVTFDATGLASGLYVYRLTAGSQILSHTMVLVK